MAVNGRNSIARRVVVVSDLEIGAGGVLDDMPRTDWFVDLLRREVAASEVPTDIVFNGDTVDLIKIALEDGVHPRFVSVDVALAKLARVTDVHTELFCGLRDLAADDRVRLVFVTGNHDYELEFPAVRDRVRELLGGAENVEFAGVGLAIGDAWIEHGSQEDSMFRFDFERPTIAHGEREVLRLPWGAVGLVDVALPLQHLFYHHDRLRPRGRVFELMPEMRELLIGRAWRYWSRDYLGRWMRRTDPLARVSWRMFREIGWRLGTANASLSVSARYRERLRSGEHRVIVIGHEHEAAWYTWSDRKLLTTGCMRYEYALDHTGGKETLLPSVYAVLEQDAEGRTLRSELREVSAPEPPVGWKPESIFDVLPTVRELLAAEKDRAKVKRAAERQAEIEAEAAE